MKLNGNELALLVISTANSVIEGRRARYPSDVQLDMEALHHRLCQKYRKALSNES